MRVVRQTTYGSFAVLLERSGEIRRPGGRRGTLAVTILSVGTAGKLHLCQ
jgi:hypothetical protein